MALRFFPAPKAEPVDATAAVCMPLANEKPKFKRFMPTLCVANTSVPRLAACIAVTIKPTRIKMFSMKIFTASDATAFKASKAGRIFFCTQ